MPRICQVSIVMIQGAFPNRYNTQRVIRGIDEEIAVKIAYENRIHSPMFNECIQEAEASCKIQVHIK